MTETQRAARSPLPNPLTTPVWKVLDDTVRSLERLGRLLAPVHRDVELTGLAALVRLRRETPCVIYDGRLANDAGSGGEPSMIPGIPGAFGCTQLRPGVLVLGAEPPAGDLRQHADIVAIQSQPIEASTEPAAPVRRGAMVDPEADGSAACFGAARQAWFALEQAQRIVRDEIAAIDRLIATLDAAPALQPRGEINADLLTRLVAVADDLLEQERERLRDRDFQQRSFHLLSRRLVGSIDETAVIITEKKTAIDQYRPGWLRRVLGKTQVDVRLHDSAINKLVEGLEKEARQSANERIRSVVRSIEKLGAREVELALGQKADALIFAPRETTRQSRLIHEAVAGSGRGFHFKLERLGAINRIMRARMEIAGIFMLVFLALSALNLSGLRKPMMIGTLILALIIAAFSYVTSHLIEEERLEDELERLREQLEKACSDAAGRFQSAILGQVLEQLEDLRDQAKAHLETTTGTSRVIRSLTNQLALKTTLTGLRSEIMRELAGTQGPAALKQQLTQLIGPGSALRGALHD